VKISVSGLPVVSRRRIGITEWAGMEL
jgi:hypothetical protein